MLERIDPQTSPEVLLSEILGSYKAEWIRGGRLYEYFVKPEYFPELITGRPCVLIGGRGTGKTTVLRGLSYEGQLALAGNKSEAISGAQFFGLYLKIDPNRVRALAGDELAEAAWAKYFGHYFNLIVTSEILTFLEWYSEQLHWPELTMEQWTDLAITLHLGAADSFRSVARALKTSLLQFEAQ